MKKKLLLVCIPALNEEKIIARVIDQIPKKLPHISSIKTVIIDDGSRDRTAVIAKKHKAIVIKHLINRGLGASLKTAFIIARLKKADILITLDADGQHNPKDITKFTREIINKKKDVVIGSRLLKNNHLMPLQRRIINQIANVVTFSISGIFSSDSQSGFRAFSKKAINKIELITQRMEVSSEIFQEIKSNNLSYSEVPIKPVYTKYSLNKGQSSLNAPMVFFKLLIRFFRR